QAQQEKGNIQRLADRYAIFFTPLTLLIAAIGFWITQEVITILAVLVVATPCPLILATPIAVLSGINRAAKVGIIVKGGAPLEKLAQVDVVVFDKTGTLTQGIPVIEKIVVFPGVEYTPDQILYRAGIIEQRSAHAVAKATTRTALEKFSVLPTPTHMREVPGAGVTGDHQSEHISVGTAEYIQTQIAPDFIESYVAFLQTFAREEKLVSVIAMNGRCLGAIFFADTPRGGAKDMINALRRMGIHHIIMLTGDNARNAHRIAKTLGISLYRATLHPEDKVTVLKEISARHPHTLMVGDGINDAPALATAYVGMAMGAQGVAISAQAADIVLLEDNIERVVDALSIGRRMLLIAKQGIWLGMGLSLVLMCIAALGYIPPPVGAVLQEIIDVTVIFNALRARK
ncbi:MAG TPA: heavy metal translocating P-type ATPase, partial [Gammaproteobacteria bacterium]|nr:heavy metal translocating P-type ATPase [Gammaproteobacteria bacterium]